MFHRHRWVEVGRTHTPGQDIKTATVDVIDDRGLRFFERMQFGLTVIEQRCESCGKLIHHEITGRVES